MGTKKTATVGAAVAVVAALTSAAPASSGASAKRAVRIGASLPRYPDSWNGCSDPCGETAQIRIAGKQVVAPFTGTITLFRIEGGGGRGRKRAPGKFRLQVLRKEDKRHYKAVRQSAVSKVRFRGKAHVTKFPTHLHVRKGDYIALEAVKWGDRWSLMKAEEDSCYRYFFYTLAIGDSSVSHPRTCQSGRVALFNARLVT